MKITFVGEQSHDNDRKNRDARVDEKKETEKQERKNNVKELTGQEIESMKQISKPLEEEESDQKTFLKRKTTMKRPTIEVSNQEAITFPPPPKVDQIDNKTKQDEEKEIRIIRCLPEGKVQYAKQVTIVFSKPMINLASSNEMTKEVKKGEKWTKEEEKRFPARIEPEIEGRWRWAGTQTLLFEPNYRFLGSTQYTITIKKGTESQRGGKTITQHTFKFETPTCKIKTISPLRKTVPLENLYILEFDQDVENKLKGISLISTTGEVELKKLDREEAIKYVNTIYMKEEKDLKLKRIESLKEKRYIMFKTVQKLKPATKYKIIVKKGFQSTEGPIPTHEAQERCVSTYKPLKMSSTYLAGETVVYIYFNNFLDWEKIDPETELLKIQPPVEHYQLEKKGADCMMIEAKFSLNTTYEIEIQQGVVDIYGQKYKGKSFKVKTPSYQFLRQISKQFEKYNQATNKNVTFDFVASRVKNVSINIFEVNYKDFPHSRMGNKYKVPTKFFGLFTDRDPSPERVAGAGKLVASYTQEIKYENEDKPKEVNLELTNYLQHPKEKIGNIIVVVKPKNWKSKAIKPILVSWIHCTKISLEVFSFSKEKVLLVNDMVTGKPVKPDKIVHGEKEIEFKIKNETVGSYKMNEEIKVGERLYAFVGDDWTLLFINNNYKCLNRGIMSTIYSDRGLYKPNETVYIKGLIRASTIDPYFKLSIPSEKEYTISVHDPTNQKIYEAIVNLNEYGAFDFNFKIPDNVNLGTFYIYHPQIGKYHSFKVLEFRTPEYMVNVAPSSPEFIVGQVGEIKTVAKYYSGESLSEANLRLVSKATVTDFRPPNCQNYRYWSNSRFSDKIVPDSEETSSVTYQGKTNVKGQCITPISFEQSLLTMKRSSTVNIKAEIQDLNGQVISSSCNLLVHPSKYFIGIKTNKGLYRNGDNIALEFKVTDSNGVPQHEKNITISLKKSFKKLKGFEKVDEFELMWEKELKTNVLGICEYNYDASTSGIFQLSASVTDEAGRIQSSRIDLLILGEYQMSYSWLDSPQLEIVANQDVYEEGDVAKILVSTPFAKQKNLEAHYFLTTEEIVEEQILNLDEYGNGVLSVPMYQKYFPFIRLTVLVRGSASFDEKKDFECVELSDSIVLEMSNDSRKINVDMKTEHGIDICTPGSQIKIIGQLTCEGKPFKGALCLYATDEAILSLSDYHLKSPIETFTYDKESPAYVYYSSRKKRFEIINPFYSMMGGMDRSVEEDALGFEISQRGGKKKKSFFPLMNFSRLSRAELQCATPSQKQISVRKTFSSLACFVSEIETNDDGTFEHLVKMPDNLTQYRFMAIAYSKNENYFGCGEHKVTIQIPLAIRPSPPRFLNFGDYAEIDFILTNQSGKDISVSLYGQFSSVFALEGSSGFHVDMKKDERCRISFPIKAIKAGIGRFQIVGTCESLSDAVEGSIPIYTPATSEVSATYGNLDGNTQHVEYIKPPSKVFNEFGHLDLTLSSTALASLTDAYLETTEPKFECSEPIASKILAFANLYDMHQAFEVENTPNEEEVMKKIASSIKSLRERQFKSILLKGSFSNYDNSILPDPFISLHVTHALVRCAAWKDSFKHLNHALRDALNFTKRVYVLLNIPPFRNIETDIKHFIQAYAIYILSLAEHFFPNRFSFDAFKKASKLYDELDRDWDNVPLEILSWIAHSMVILKDDSELNQVQTIMKFLNNRVQETAKSAHFITGFSDDAKAKLLLLHSNARTDAILLDFFIKADPTNPLIPKLMHGLMDARRNGLWSSTQESVFALIASKNYFETFEHESPDFDTSVWYADLFMGEASFKQRSNEVKQVKIPMKFIVPDPSKSYEAQPLIVSKEGPGRLYYRLALSYAPKQLILPALNHGFLISRSYIPIDNPNHKTVLSDGTIQLKYGQLYRIKIRMVNVSRRYHVALVDSVPSGLEPLNPDLPTHADQIPKSESDISKSAPRYDYWFGYRSTWYRYQNIRTERVEAFTDALWCGEHVYSYVARATTRGRFIVPPAKAVEMYNDDIFGRSHTDIVLISQ